MKQEINKPKNKKRLLTFVVLGIFITAGIVTASWILFYNTSTASGLNIISEGVLIFSDDFEVVDGNTNNAGVWINSSIFIENSNGLRDLNLSWITTAVDNVTDTCDNAGDYNLDVIYEGVAVTNGGIITLQAGTNEIIFNSSAIRDACPSLYSTTATLDSDF